MPGRRPIASSFVLVAAMLSAPSDAALPTDVPAAPRVLPDQWNTVVAEFSMLSGVPRADLDNVPAGDIDRLVEAAVTSREFARRVIPRFLSVEPLGRKGPVSVRYTLKSTSAGVLYLREPCEPSAAVNVRPWWNPDGTVQICADSYRPEVHFGPDGFACGGYKNDPTKHLFGAAIESKGAVENAVACGCGEYLKHCAKDKEHERAVDRSFDDEVIETAAYVVEHDLPFHTILTMNESIRDWNVEFYYRRVSDTNGTPLVLDDWRAWAKPRLAPRPDWVEGHHGGILTMAKIIYASNAVRTVMDFVMADLVCKKPSSVLEVATANVLDLGKRTVDVRFGVSSGQVAWDIIAKRPICTECHARLDSASRFFFGYQSDYSDVDFRRALFRAEPVTWYLDDIHDPQAEAPNTPRGLGLILARHDATKACLAGKFSSYFLGDDSDQTSVNLILQAARNSGTFRAMGRIALRLLAHKLLRAQSVENDLSASTRSVLEPKAKEGASVTLSSASKHALDGHCARCHGTDDTPNLDRNTLPRSTLMLGIDRILGGEMPKDRRLSLEERRGLISTLLTDALHDAPALEAEARRYYLGADGPLSYPIEAVLQEVARGLPPSDRAFDWRYEKKLAAQGMHLTPGHFIKLAIEAENACAKTKGGRDCIDESLSIDSIARP
jgi:hypothetical protein